MFESPIQDMLLACNSDNLERSLLHSDNLRR